VLKKILKNTNSLFEIIRWKNLLIIASIQLLFRFYLFPLFYIESTLNLYEFIAVLFATIMIAIGGYIINDVYDVEIDVINKPNKVWISNIITLKKAKRVYLFISLIGLLVGAFVSFSIEKPLYFSFFLVPFLALFLYARTFKKVLLIGNILVSSLVAFSLLLIPLLEKFINSETNFYKLERIVWMLFFFAFIINFIREIVKDAEDQIGDKAFGVNSFPIKYGKEVTHTLLKLLVGVLLGAILAVSYTYYNEQTFFVIYLGLGVLPALLLFLKQLLKVKTTDDYSKLSTLLKLIMLVGIVAIFMIKPY